MTKFKVLLLVPYKDGSRQVVKTVMAWSRDNAVDVAKFLYPEVLAVRVL